MWFFYVFVVFCFLLFFNELVMAYTFLLKYVANPAEQEKLVSPEHEVCTPSLDIGIDFSSTENAMKVSNAFNSFLAYGENKREFLGGCTYR